MGSKYQTANYAGTGEQTIIEVDPRSTTSLAINAGGSDVYTVDIVLKETNGTRTAIPDLVDLSGNLVKEITGPIAGVGLNITTNTSADITIEVRESKRAV